MRRTSTWLVALLAAALGLTAAACFEPDHPACAFSCADAPHTCPSGYTCGDDNLCHDPNSPGTCGIVAADGAATPDTGSPNDSAAER
jgi:hypothetical protein